MPTQIDTRHKQHRPYLRSKVVSATEAVGQIRDGDTVVTGGFVGIGFAENIAVALEDVTGLDITLIYDAYDRAAFFAGRDKYRWRTMTDMQLHGVMGLVESLEREFNDGEHFEPMPPGTGPVGRPLE